MNLPKITFKIEDRVYRLDASDGPEIRKMPKQDRQHLLTLLAAIQKQESYLEGEGLENQTAHSQTAHSTAQTPQLVRPQTQVSAVSKASTSTAGLEQDKPEARDADQIMARLIADEKKNSKSISKRQLYIVFSIITFTILLFLLMLI